MASQRYIQYILARRNVLRRASKWSETLASIEAARRGEQRSPPAPSEMDIVWEFLETCYEKYSNPLRPDWIKNIDIADRQLEKLIKRGVTTIGYSSGDSELTVFTKIALADGSLPRVMPLPPPRPYPHP